MVDNNFLYEQKEGGKKTRGKEEKLKPSLVVWKIGENGKKNETKFLIKKRFFNEMFDSLVLGSAGDDLVSLERATRIQTKAVHQLTSLINLHKLK